MRDFTVRDDDRAVVFQGIELAGVDNLGQRRGRERTGDDLRWTELSIYKTLNGTYLMEKVGRSDVYHRVFGGPDKCRGYGTAAPAFFLDEDHRPCPNCAPPAAGEFAEGESVRVETDRFTLVRADTAASLVAACHSADSRGGYEFLTTLARDALRAAGQKDRAIADAFATEKVA